MSIAREGSERRKLAVVTGATSGIGLETARGLARAGCDLVLACRNLEKAAATRAAISAEFHGAVVEALQLDLASFASIRSFAAGLVERHGSVDLLVNNAGVFCDARRLTVDGFEMTMGVNFLGTYLLTSLLLPLLLTAAVSRESTRIVNVSSAAAAYGRIRRDEGIFTRGPHGFRGYAASKLALVLFTLELSEELAGRGVTANAVHPGDAATDIWRGESLLMRIVGPLMRRSLRSPAEAARAVLRAVTAEDLAGVTGRFLDDSGELPILPKYRDASLRHHLMRRAAATVAPFAAAM
jgi:NAD(P)-dependent dehydrogenase (short-subunit alcohol dehydrogenase family)